MRWSCDKSPACSPPLPPGRVPHVRGLSRTWVEHDLFPMLSPPVFTYLQEKKKEGLPRISCEIWRRFTLLVLLKSRRTRQHSIHCCKLKSQLLSDIGGPRSH